MNHGMRILAVDPGSKHIGVAISDPSASLAKPIAVINHVSRIQDAGKVIQLAKENEVGLILVGQSFDENGEPSFEGRRAQRFAEALQSQSNIPIILWDEAMTTQDARQASLKMGTPRKKRSGHLDSLAAAILLQSYLDRPRSA